MFPQFRHHKTRKEITYFDEGCYEGQEMPLLRLADEAQRQDERPLVAAELLRAMSADADIDLLYEPYATNPRESEAPSWGDGLAWRELHRQTPYPYAFD